MKRKIKVLILVCIVAMVGVLSVFTLSGCGDGNSEPRDVLLEVINPNTGEVLKAWDHIEYPGENTLIEVRIKDKKTGKYLTDDDLPDNTVRGCFTFYLERLNKDYTSESDLSVWGEGSYDDLGYWHRPYGVWPQNEEGKHNLYELSVWFDCKPKNIEQSDFKRKYNSQIMRPDLKFYID